MLFHTLLHYAEVLVIAKFNIRQCILMTDSSNLMLAKVSRYTVGLFSFYSSIISHYHTDVGNKRSMQGDQSWSRL